MIFFPTVSSPPFPSYVFGYFFLLVKFYCISPPDFQGHFRQRGQTLSAPPAMGSRRKSDLLIGGNISAMNATRSWNSCCDPNISSLIHLSKDEKTTRSIERKMLSPFKPKVNVARVQSRRHPQKILVPSPERRTDDKRGDAGKSAKLL